MAEEYKSGSDPIGDAPGVNGGPSINAAPALAAVQAEQIKRLEQQQQQTEEQARAAAASPPLAAPPLLGPDLTDSVPVGAVPALDPADVSTMQEEVARAEQRRVSAQRAQSASSYRPAFAPSASAPLTPHEQALAEDWAYFQKQPSAPPALSGRFSAGAGFADEFTVNPDDERLEADLFSRAPQQQAHEARREQFEAMSEQVAPGAPDPLADDWFETAHPTRDLKAEGFEVRDSADDPRSPRYGNYAEASARRSQIEGQLRDRYTQEGRYSDIGNTGYKSELRSNLAEEDLAEPQKTGLAGVKQRMAEEWNGPWGKLNYAFAAGDLLQGAGKMYALNNSGQYVTPEQQETGAAGLLPGVGALVGTALGGWGGGIVGGGVGTLAQGVVGANEQREGAAREASERLAASLGLSADAAERFKGAIEGAGASTQAMAQGLAALQASGPGVGAQAIAGAARSALSEGEYYAADTAATSKFLSSDPALAPLAQTYRTQGELTQGQYQGIASLALAEGDMGEFNTAQLQASRAARNDDPAYQGAAKKLQADQGDWVSKADHALTAVSRFFGGSRRSDAITEDQDETDLFGKLSDTQSKQETQNYVAEYADINRGKQNLFDAGLQTRIGEAGFSMAEMHGGGSQALRGLLPGLNASSRAAVAADQLIIDTDTKMMAGLAADDPTRPGWQNLINSARADMVGKPIADAQRDRHVFDVEMAEHSADYDLDRSASSASLLTGRLAGRTNAQLQGQEDVLLGNQRGYANQQRQDAANPLLRPDERSAMLARANALDSDAAQQGYGFKMGGYAQNLAVLDTSIAQVGLGITQAKAFGTSDEVYSAQGREADALAAKMRELTSEIARGGMTVEDMTGKVRQRTQAEEQQVQVLAQRRDDRLAASSSLADSDFTIDTAGMSRRVRSEGSGAVDFDTVNAGFQEKFRDDQKHIDAYAPDDPRRRAGQARLASDQAGSRDYEGNLLSYAPSAALGMEGTAAEDALGRARHAFHREMLAPYESSDPESNPLTRGMNLNKAIGGSLAFIGKEEADMTGERSRRQGQVGADGRPLWDNIAEQGYQRQMLGFHEQEDTLKDERAQIEHDRRFAMLRALPEMIAGGGGTGNSVSSFSFDALSAAYSPNVLMGSWGSPSRPSGVSVPGSMPGNAVEAFQQNMSQRWEAPLNQGGWLNAGQHHAAAAPSGSTLTAAIENLSHGMNTNQLAALLQQLIAEVRIVANNTNARTGGQAGPPRSFGSTAAQALGQTFNPNRPSR